MKSFPNIITIRNAILEKLNTTGGTLTVIFVLMGMGFTVGKYYEEVILKREIMELVNKQTIELIDLRNKQSLEIIELQRKISHLEIENEKSKK